MPDTRPIFVFGSNLAGRHGKGAALYAARHFSAQRGVGQGPTGHAYALPTKDENMQVFSTAELVWHINEFLKYAARNGHLTFQLTPVGCGLAGHSAQDVWRILKGIGVPGNVYLSASWVNDH